MSGPLVFDDVEAGVDEILKRVGKTVVIGLPLGLGKPVELVNALYRRAAAEPGIQLKILTALSLEKPSGASALENRFLEPFVQRVFGRCPDLEYLAALHRNELPPNVTVCEFFFKPGSFLNNAHAQRHYISSNYTHAARDVFAQGCNVLAQMVARREADGETRYSLSCNPDTGPELRQRLKDSGRPHVTVCQVNQNLPYMHGDAEVPGDYFDLVVDHPRYTVSLFSTPKLAVTAPDYLIGLNASALIKDGGTLQIGIGALGDAIVYAARLRHEHNDTYRKVLNDCGILARSESLIRDAGETGPFEQGLYGATEMFVDGFMHLYRAGILKRHVYDFTELQRLLNDGRASEEIAPEVLDRLEAEGVRVIRTQDFEVLQYHGLFRDDCRYDLGHVVAPDGEHIMANLAIPEARAKLKQKCLGRRLRNGVVLHGGFFLGPNDFYQSLRDLSDAERRRFCMTGVDKINQLDRDPELYKAQRRGARFMNTGLMVTLSGHVVSDGLEDGRVISGVGGQYNFVAMAHQLPGGRSILLIRSVREHGGGAASNVVFNYGHVTIPRHLRDLVVTEYGIADLRSKTDNEVIKALLNVADSRFQPQLLEQARRSGKLEADYAIPEAFRHNTRECLETWLAPHRRNGLFPDFPLGCDFTPEELTLGRALRALKARVEGTPRWKLALSALRAGDTPAAARPYLERLGLTAPKTFQDRVARELLIEELKKAGAL